VTAGKTPAGGSARYLGHNRYWWNGRHSRLRTCRHKMASWFKSRITDRGIILKQRPEGRASVHAGSAHMLNQERRGRPLGGPVLRLEILFSASRQGRQAVA
jgi:hypothetical protein